MTCGCCGQLGCVVSLSPKCCHTQVYFEDPNGFNYALMDWLQRNVPSTTKSPTDGFL